MSAVMEIEDVAPLLAELGFENAQVTRVDEGWASQVFDLDDAHVLRIARTSDIAATHRREARLLPELSEAVSFAVPVPTRVGEYRGHTYMTYRKIPGRPLQPGDDLAATARMLRELHDFPVDRAAALLGDPMGSAQWRDDFAEYRQWIESDVLPELDAPLGSMVCDSFERALSSLTDFTPVLVHRDLGTSHILVNADTKTPVGIIDFETASIGDPTIDFVGLFITLGEAETRRIAKVHPHPVSWERLRFYWWMGAIHAIKYGVDTGDPRTIAEGVEGLRNRLLSTVSE